MSAQVVHFEIIGKEGAKLRDFYGQLFDWKINVDNSWDYGMVDASESGIGGGIGAGETTGATFYVEVPDLEATLAQVEKMGGKTVVPPTEIPNVVTFATFVDPEGNRIGLVKA